LLEPNYVNASFLRDDFEIGAKQRADAPLGSELRQHHFSTDPNLVRTMRVKAEALDKATFANFNLDQDGFTLYEMPGWFKTAFGSIARETVYQMATSGTVEDDYQVFHDKAGPLLVEQLVTDFFNMHPSLNELRGEYPDGVVVKCSKTIKPRSSQAKAGPFILPPNTLFHTDYYTAKSSYKRQCLEQDQWDFPMECPPYGDMIDHWNVWFPLTAVKDWPLGFLDLQDFARFIPVMMVQNSTAASMKYHPDVGSVKYVKDMAWGDMYVFRSGTSQRGVGPMHTSFPITTKKESPRFSLEARCMLFKKHAPQPSGLEDNDVFSDFKDFKAEK